MYILNKLNMNNYNYYGQDNQRFKKVYHKGSD